MGKDQLYWECAVADIRTLQEAKEIKEDEHRLSRIDEYYEHLRLIILDQKEGKI